MTYQNLLRLFDGPESSLLLKGSWGLEKESLRITGKGHLALTPHPKKFGNKLENPEITVDFSESQVEMITPPVTSLNVLYRKIIQLQDKVKRQLSHEYLWPYSLPAILPDERLIPVAVFDNSERGKLQTTYRLGLALKYGKKMQTISGIHYNFSFHTVFWDFLAKNTQSGLSDKDFIEQCYLSIARNMIRYRWLYIYLFGVSPIAHASFTNKQSDFNELNTYYNSAVSLRLSPYGYSSFKQNGVRISYDSLTTYTQDLDNALSQGLIQKESEFYSPVRLKAKVRKGESHLEKLKSSGISYLEFRSIDLDPFDKAGISLEQLRFTHLFALFCLFMESNPISGPEMQYISSNDYKTALLGREEGLALLKSTGEPVGLENWAFDLLGQMKGLAVLLDKGAKSNGFKASLEAQMNKVFNKALLPASRLAGQLKALNIDIIEFGLSRARPAWKNFVQQGFQVLRDLSLFLTGSSKDASRRKYSNYSCCQR